MLIVLSVFARLQNQNKASSNLEFQARLHCFMFFQLPNWFGLMVHTKSSLSLWYLSAKFDPVMSRLWYKLTNLLVVASWVLWWYLQTRKLWWCFHPINGKTPSGAVQASLHYREGWQYFLAPLFFNSGHLHRRISAWLWTQLSLVGTADISPCIAGYQDFPLK